MLQADCPILWGRIEGLVGEDRGPLALRHLLCLVELDSWVLGSLVDVDLLALVVEVTGLEQHELVADVEEVSLALSLEDLQALFEVAVTEEELVLLHHGCGVELVRSSQDLLTEDVSGIVLMLLDQLGLQREQMLLELAGEGVDQVVVGGLAVEELNVSLRLDGADPIAVLSVVGILNQRGQEDVELTLGLRNVRKIEQVVYWSQKGFLKDEAAQMKQLLMAQDECLVHLCHRRLRVGVLELKVRNQLGDLLCEVDGILILVSVLRF